MKATKKAVIKVDNLTFLVSSFCYERIGMTENMKFRLECVECPLLGGVYDDYKSLMDELNKYIFDSVIQTVL